VVYWFFRKQKSKIKLIPVEKIKSWFPTVLLVGLIVSLAASSFIDSEFSYAAGILCVIASVIALVWAKLNSRISVLKSIRNLDWETTFFLLGVFILVGSLTAGGLIEIIAGVLSGVVGQNLFLGYTVLVVIAVLISSVVDNVPFLAAMLPVAISMAQRLHVAPELFLFGLLIGASLGGNITPIGASANIVACSLLKKEGVEVKFPQFMRIGVPFTIAAVSAAYLFVWFIWGK